MRKQGCATEAKLGEEGLCLFGLWQSKSDSAATIQFYKLQAYFKVVKKTGEPRIHHPAVSVQVESSK